MSQDDDAPVPIFGLPQPGREYVERPGAYALISDGAGRLAVVRNAFSRCFLPGGGTEPGESLELALRREVLEECGRHVDEVEELCAADQYVEDPADGRCYPKRGTFFLATLHDQPAVPAEDGTELLWLTPPEASHRLAHPSQAWVVRQFGWMISGPQPIVEI